MNEVLETIQTRRSIRRYTGEQIPEEILQEIITAGLYAPGAGGRQSGIMVVCQEREINDALGRANRGAFGAPGAASAFRVSTEQPSIADDPNIPSAFYGAPTVISLFAPRGMVNGPGDCWCMGENMLLAAHALGIGSCVVARATSTFEGELGQRLLVEWGVPENYEPILHVVMGYRDGAAPHDKPRREGRVIRVQA
ncbi:MAG: nitroreductase family protein [Anaerolineae bacterium]